MESISPFSTPLIVLGSLCWITVYAEAVRVGLRDKSYAIPIWVIGLNFSWDVIYCFLAWRFEGQSPQAIIFTIRFFLDILVLYTWFSFGRKHFPANPGESWFVPWSLLVIVAAFALQIAFIMQVGIYPGRAYAAFLQNLVMPLLLIAMLARRKRRKGQSMIIAAAKLTGTLALTIPFGILGTDEFKGPNNLLLVIGILSCLFDVIYLSLLSQADPYEKKEPGNV
jgi:hypothetical protein